MTAGWALDLDGVIWRGSQTVPGSAKAVAALREAGVPIAFVTNSAQRTPQEVAQKLAQHGIADAEHEVITSAMAAATLVEPGERVLAVGMAGLRTALLDRECELVDEGPADAVVMGIDLDFDYATMNRAMQAVNGGARFIATNTDASFPAAGGLQPGNGALVASVATATGVEPEVAGKPGSPIAVLTKERLGSSGIMVGDRPDTDGIFAEALGFGFGLVLSGVTAAADLPVEPSPIAVSPCLKDLVDAVLGGDVSWT